MERAFAALVNERVRGFDVDTVREAIVNMDPKRLSESLVVAHAKELRQIKLFVIFANDGFKFLFQKPQQTF